MPKKKFIDKKHATTFVLAHRSQRDPLIADENAPQNILLPMDQVPSMAGAGPQQHKHEKHDESAKAKRKEELLKYGVYFDDDYDYLQHLRNGTEVSNVEWDYCERIYAPDITPAAAENSTPITKDDLKEFKLKLPSSVFESEFKEDIGMLNKAATSRGPRPDLDPDVIAALDDDFDYKNPENELEDNFIELANPEGGTTPIEGEPAPEDLEGLFSDEEEMNYNSDSDDYEDEKADRVGHLGRPGPGYCFSESDDDNKSRFTSYSMSSSVVRRNKQLLLVDDCFEKMYENYDDTEIGALDCDEIEGDINPDSALLLKYAEEFENDRKKEELINEKITNLALRSFEESDSNEDMSDSDEDGKKREKWDCESILSTYSNTKNRPKVIKEPSKRNLIRISGKTGMPVGVLGKGLTKHNLRLLDDKNAEENNIMPSSRGKSLITGATSVRNKDETTEERRERKKLVKEYRKERRLERKANTEAFKDEKKRLEKVRINDRHNIPGLKL